MLGGRREGGQCGGRRLERQGGSERAPVSFFARPSEHKLAALSL